MKKLLFIINTLSPGGVENVLINLVNNLDPAKYKIDVLVMEHPGDARASLISKNVTLRCLYRADPAKQSSALKRYAYGIARELAPRFILRKKASLDGYDAVIDYMGLNTNLLRAAKCRRILWSHGDRSLETNPVERAYFEKNGNRPNERFKQRMYLKTLKRVDDIVCISETLKKGFIGRFGFEGKVSVVHNIMDTDRIAALATQDPGSVPWRADIPAFCYVTRLVEGKGVERLIDSCERLWADGKDFSLVIIGGGKLLSYTKERAGAHADRLFVLGEQANPFGYLKKCDAFVCASETEAWPTVIWEALSLDLPVISTDVGSVREMLGDSEYGLVVENSAEGVYGGMKKALEEPSFFDHYAKKAAERKKFFSVERSVAEADALFEKEE